MTTTEKTQTKKTGSKDGNDLLKASLKHLVGAVTEKGVKTLTDTVTSTVGHLDNVGTGTTTAMSGLAKGESPAKAALKAGASSVTGKLKEKGQDLKNALTGGKGKSKGKSDRIINIVEQIDIGAPVDLVYDQWTQFADFPQFMKKLEQVEQVSDEKLRWKAQVFWSHRSWESTIVEQVPDERIVWRSKGDKGYLDGAVTFHEVTPDLTRVLLVVVYHPQGLFEKTGNIWRAQGRRIRLELKHFRRHVMTQAVLHPDEIEGWRGEIHDDEITPPEEMEDTERDEEEEDTEAEGDYPEDEEPEDEEPEDDDVEDEAEDDEAEEDEEEPEQAEPAAKAKPQRKRRARAST